MRIKKISNHKKIPNPSRFQMLYTPESLPKKDEKSLNSHNLFFTSLTPLINYIRDLNI
jgi:hypothetical protein